MLTKKQIRSRALKKAVDFLKVKYKNKSCQLALDSITIDDIQWSSTCKFAKLRSDETQYFLNCVQFGYARDYKSNKEKPIRIQENRNWWITYKRKTIGFTVDHPVSEVKAIEIQLVHELTHMMQCVEDRGSGEVETTRNELEYVQSTYPSLYDRVVEKIKD